MHIPVIILHPEDDVAIALQDLPGGTEIEPKLMTAADVEAGHKIARQRISRGAYIHRYNQIIGVASRDIDAGEHIHSHNLDMAEFARDY
ncbi:MAG: UxaA family hydrolase, partial [Pseudomonadota bacterium]